MSADLGKQPRVRASDAEREVVVERLREAMAEGRLTLEELADRCEAAYLARYRDDLDRIAADLPPAQESALQASVLQRSEVRGSASAPGETGVYRSKMNDATFDRPVPDADGRLTAVAGFGDLTLNLAHVAVPASGELHVTAKAWLSDVRLMVPEGVRLSVDGGVRDRRGKRKQPLPEDAPCVHVSGTGFLGEVTVQRPKGARSAWREWIEDAVDSAMEFISLFAWKPVPLGIGRKGILGA